MKNLIFGIIGVVWGGLVILGSLLNKKAASVDTAYGAGAWAGLIFAVLLFAAGSFCIIKWIRSRRSQLDGE